MGCFCYLQNLFGRDRNIQCRTHALFCNGFRDIGLALSVVAEGLGRGTRQPAIGLTTAAVTSYVGITSSGREVTGLPVVVGGLEDPTAA